MNGMHEIVHIEFISNSRNWVRSIIERAIAFLATNFTKFICKNDTLFTVEKD